MAETVTNVLAELKSLGTAQNRKIYARHGATGGMFGVSYGNLNKIAKRIKKNTDLARELWASGNTDARTLATLITDPKLISGKELDQWAAGINFTGLADYFVSKLVLNHSEAEDLMQRWCKSKKEYVIRCGYHLLALIARDKKEIPDSFFLPHLEYIEANIHSAPNRGREGMLNALMGIGYRNDTLRKKALEAAKRIGPVEIDHGQTSCKTPDAVAKLSK